MPLFNKMKKTYIIKLKNMKNIKRVLGGDGRLNRKNRVGETYILET